MSELDRFDAQRFSPHPALALLLAAAVTLFIGVSLLGIDTARGVGLAAPNPSIETLTVRVSADGCGTLRTGSGTRLGGGHIATAAHVVGDATTVVVSDDRGFVAEAEVVSLEAGGLDIAILEVGVGLESVVRAFGTEHPSPVVFAGHPGGGLLRSVETEAFTVAAEAFDLEGSALLSLSDAPVEGMSGGPVVDDHGRLLGVVTSANTVNSTGLAVPVVELEELLERGVVDSVGCR